MSKYDIKIADKEYKDVSTVKLKKTDGNTVSFHDVSETTATASDVAIGKKFLTGDGEYAVGSMVGDGVPRFTIIQTPNQKITVDSHFETELYQISDNNGTEVWERKERVTKPYRINLVPEKGWDCGKLLLNGEEVTDCSISNEYNDRGFHTTTYDATQMHNAIITATEATERVMPKAPPAMFNFEVSNANFKLTELPTGVAVRYLSLNVNNITPSSQMAQRIPCINIYFEVGIYLPPTGDEDYGRLKFNGYRLVFDGSSISDQGPMSSKTESYPSQECELYVNGENCGHITMENKEILPDKWAWCADISDSQSHELIQSMEEWEEDTSTITLVGFLCPHQTSIVGEEFSFREVDISDRNFELPFTSSSKGMPYMWDRLYYDDVLNQLTFPNIDISYNVIYTSGAGWCSIWIDDMCVIPKIFADTEDIDDDGYHTFIKLSDEELADIRLRLESIASTADEINREVGATRLPPGTEPIYHTLSFKEPVIGKVPNEIGDTALELQCMIVDVTSEKIIDDKGVIYKAVVGKQKPLVIDNVDILLNPLDASYSLALEGRTNFKWHTAYPLSSNKKYKLEIDGDYICDVVSNDPTLGGEHDDYYNTTYTQTFNLLNPSDENPIYHYFADLTKVRTVKLKTITDTTPPDVDVDPSVP